MEIEKNMMEKKKACFNYTDLRKECKKKLGGATGFLLLCSFFILIIG
jgi:hypothetical protein